MTTTTFTEPTEPLSPAAEALLAKAHSETVLRKAGLSRYQARIVLALLNLDRPATSAEIAAASPNILPRTSIYAEIAHLVDIGAVVELDGPRSKVWSAPLGLAGVAIALETAAGLAHVRLLAAIRQIVTA